MNFKDFIVKNHLVVFFKFFLSLVGIFNMILYI